MNYKYGDANSSDSRQLPVLICSMEEKISAVCGDMAYDTLRCRKAIKLRGARQLIPPIRKACLSYENNNMRKAKNILQQRDDAVNYIRYNTINGNSSLGRKSWKYKSGYHAGSLIETNMLQIKRHNSDYLANKREDTKNTQSGIKCKIVNLINAA